MLRPLLPSGTRCALVGYPGHWNVGDSAIWLATRVALRSLDVGLGYLCDTRSYRADALAEAVGSGAILLSGGGNFGDVWSEPQLLREQVLSDFPNNRVIQLPQSLHFEKPENLERARRICSRHADFTLLVREQQSFEFAEKNFDTPIQLCPDMSFQLGRRDRTRPPEKAVLWLAREDREARVGERLETGDDVERVDWAASRSADHSPAGRLAHWWKRKATRRIRAGRPGSRNLWRALGPAYDALARAQVERGFAILSRGQTVLTDRLHGHVLSLLLGIPHVVLDNSYGKIRSTIDSWTSESALVHLCDTPREGLARARSLAAEGESPWS